MSPSVLSSPWDQLKGDGDSPRSERLLFGLMGPKELVGDKFPVGDNVPIHATLSESVVDDTPSEMIGLEMLVGESSGSLAKDPADAELIRRMRGMLILRRIRVVTPCQDWRQGVILLVRVSVGLFSASVSTKEVFLKEHPRLTYASWRHDRGPPQDK